VFIVQDVIEGNVNKFMYQVGKTHRDDDAAQQYITEMMYINRNSGKIVDEIVLLLKNGRKLISLDLSPIHIRDIVKLSKVYEVNIHNYNKTLATKLQEITTNRESIKNDPMPKWKYK